MADVVDRVTRSRMMSGIRGKDTGIEVRLRKALFSMGWRYRLHARGMPGRPDIVLPRVRAVVFVHGCFWHGHGCPLFRLPATRTEFWQEKIAANRSRDRRVVADLLDAGWRVLTVWECSLRDRSRRQVDSVVRRADRWLRGGRRSAELRR